jgi:hypothetical protein
MSARWILVVAAAVFAVLVIFRLVRNRGRWDPASRTWTIIAVIFAIVSIFLLRQG